MILIVYCYYFWKGLLLSSKMDKWKLKRNNSKDWPRGIKLYCICVRENNLFSKRIYVQFSYV